MFSFYSQSNYFQLDLNISLKQIQYLFRLIIISIKYHIKTHVLVSELVMKLNESESNKAYSNRSRGILRLRTVRKVKIKRQGQLGDAYTVLLHLLICLN